MRRETGGNRFVGPEPTLEELTAAVERGLRELAEWFAETGRAFDPGRLTITTMRTLSGDVSLSVTGDGRCCPAHGRGSTRHGGGCVERPCCRFCSEHEHPEHHGRSRCVAPASAAELLAGERS